MAKLDEGKCGDLRKLLMKIDPKNMTKWDSNKNLCNLDLGNMGPFAEDFAETLYVLDIKSTSESTGDAFVLGKDQEDAKQKYADEDYLDVEWDEMFPPVDFFVRDVREATTHEEEAQLGKIFLAYREFMKLP